MTGTFHVSEAYRPRRTAFCEVHELHGWKLKVYTVLYDDTPIDWPCYEEGLALAGKALPQPPVAQDRPGVGFVIAHQGRGVHYLVLNWWANENEYFNRVFVRPLDKSAPWRAAHEGESACVWDLEIIWFERQAYVDCVLNEPGRGDVATYLARHMGGEA